MYTIGMIVRRVWRYQRSNQNPYIEDEQTTQWPKEKVQKDKQCSTKHTSTYKTKDRVTRILPRTGVISVAPEGWAVPAPLVAPVVLFKLQILGKDCKHEFRYNVLYWGEKTWKLGNMSIILQCLKGSNIIYNIALSERKLYSDSHFRI